MPLVIALSVFILESCPCGVNESVTWYSLQSLASYFPSLLFTLYIDHLLKQNSRRKSVFHLFVAQSLIAIGALLLFWLLPQKRMVHFFIGYLHGPIYDRWIPADANLFAIRTLTLLISVSILLAYRGRLKKWSLSIASLLIFIYLPLSWLIPDHAHGIWALKKELNQKIDRKYFTIHYSGKRSIDRLVSEAEFHIRELSAWMEVKPSHTDICLR